MEIKQHSTGNNDSVEDVLIAIRNIKTTDGKYLDSDTQWKAVKSAWRGAKYIFGYCDSIGE